MTNLVVKNLTKIFPDGTKALQNVSFEAEQGEGIVLLGSNGSGKSTLIRCISGLELPTRGSIQIGTDRGIDDSGGDLKRVRQSVGMVFQQFNLVDSLSVFHNVLHGALGRSRGPHYWWPTTAPEAERRRAMDCLERVELAEFAPRRVDTLSGGQQQRVGIARMLMQNPEIVLADEPVSSLDPNAGRQVMDLLWNIVREEQQTVICILHQVELAREYGDRMIALRQGRKVLDQSMESVGDEQLNALYSDSRGSESVRARAV